ncbi:hypothetical protein BSKO_13472 [Bryopsis sp. KO-2023]|nr:hypothetical protein BSKO_13472 [Bryopsis sp. KO-2023]
MMWKARGVACALFFCALACACAQRVPLKEDVANNAPESLLSQLANVRFFGLGRAAETNTTKEEEPVLTQMELNAKFINATKRDNVEGVEKYLEMGAELNLTTGVAERTVLHIASKTGGTELIEFLIEAGAEVDALTIGRATPLHVAAADNRADAARLLLENGADIDATTTDGNSPLHWAATQGHPEVAEVLLEYGADRTALNAFAEIPIEILCCCECGEDSNCSCKDRGSLVWMLDFSQRGDKNTSLVLETPSLDSSSENDNATETETILALEDDSVFSEEEEEADAPLPL